jgi:hypothetical protein
MSYKLVQEFYDSKGKDTNSTSKKASSNPKVPIYPKVYTARKTIFSTLLSRQLPDDFTNIWYIDSDTTDHFTGSKSFFITYKEINPFLITLGNELIILIKGKGTILLATKPELKIQFSNIFYSSQFRNNSLLLIPKIIRARGNIIFSQRNIRIINKGITIITSIFSLFIRLY